MVIPILFFFLSSLVFAFDIILGQQGSLIRKRIELVVACLFAIGSAALALATVQMLVFR